MVNGYVMPAGMVGAICKAVMRAATATIVVVQPSTASMEVCGGAKCEDRWRVWQLQVRRGSGGRDGESLVLRVEEVQVRVGAHGGRAWRKE